MQTLSGIDAVLQESGDAGRVPGVVALATHGAEQIYQGAFGKRNAVDGPGMTLDTMFWIASMTKAVTSVAVMQLVERGKIELDAPLGSVVAGLDSPQVLEGFDGSGAPRLRPAKRPVTLRHLLTHSAGFGYEIWNENIVRYNEVTGTPSIFSLQNAALGVPLLFDPGEKWEYGINLDWVGRIVETLSGQTIDAYFKENIFGPLGMKDTTFAPNDEQKARMSAMHARMPDGSLAPMPFEMAVGDFLMGGGGLFGTGSDYLRFLQMVLGGGSLNGTQVLKPQTIGSMLQNQIGDLTVRPLPTQMPAYSNDVELYPGMALKWGLGFLITTEDVPGARNAGSCSWAGLANTHFWIDPKANLAGVILTQVLPFGDAGAMATYDAFERGVYASLGAHARTN
jgi:CubicO group peptidase (beta-lactamase class C family)